MKRLAVPIALLLFAALYLWGQSRSMILNVLLVEKTTGADLFLVEDFGAAVLGDPWVEFTVYDPDSNGLDLGLRFIEDTDTYAEITTRDHTGGVSKWSFGSYSDTWATAAMQNAFYVIQRTNSSDGSVGLHRLTIADDGNMGVNLGNVAAIHSLETSGALRIGDEGTKPSCAAGERGTVWHDFGGAGVKDTVEVCAKDAANAYAWRVLY